MDKGVVKRVIVTPDKHFPIHDKKAIKIVCKAIEIVKPDIYIDLGDTGEWEHFSSHYWKGRSAKPMEDLIPLLNKDVNFLREAYPVTTTAKRGLPKFYAYHSTSGSNVKFMFSPIPDANYTLEHIYAKYPTSIVTAGGTYLGDNFDSALLNAALVEAARFQKSEPDIIQNYDKMFLEYITLLKNTMDGKLTQDYYRSGQPRADVR